MAKARASRLGELVEVELLGKELPKFLSISELAKLYH